MIPKICFMVRVGRRTGSPGGGGRIQEEKWFETHGAATKYHESVIHQPLVTRSQLMVVLDERTKNLVEEDR
jgi:hypothetical protein